MAHIMTPPLRTALPGKRHGGIRLVNEQYPREQQMYLLQAKTVRFVRDLMLPTALALFAQVWPCGGGPGDEGRLELSGLEFSPARWFFRS